MKALLLKSNQKERAIYVINKTALRAMKDKPKEPLFIVVIEEKQRLKFL